MMRRRVSAAVTMMGLLCAAGLAAGGETEIVNHIAAFFRSTDPVERAAIAARIEDDPAYDRTLVRTWLHRAELFEPVESGERRVTVPVDHGQNREVLIRVPRGYDPARPWPLIYALHGTGGTHEGIVQYVSGLLGERIDEYIIAAPGDYRQVAMGEDGPPSVEHPALLRAIKRKLHVNSDRVHVIGYSKGGYTTWTLATLHADQFAAALPIACTYSMLPYVEGLWETMLPNLRHVMVLHCWGERDSLPTLNLGGRAMDATIAEQNRDRLVPLTRRLGLSKITHHEQPGAGHGGIVPPTGAFEDALRSTRVHFPRVVHHRFRYIHQAGAYWMEGISWQGEQWSNKALRFQPRTGETVEQTLGRVIHARLGAMSGEIDGQTIHVAQEHVADMVVWFGDGMIDFSEPVRVVYGHETAYDGLVTPDLLVCLSQAARTYDFDRLRWAGLRLKGAGKARPVTGRMRFPVRPEEE